MTAPHRLRDLADVLEEKYLELWKAAQYEELE
jgi:hypothetical protein